MKLTAFSTNDFLVKLTDGDLQEIFENSISVISKYLSADQILTTEENYREITGKSVEDFPYVQLDTLEGVLNTPSMEALKKFGEGLCSTSVVVNRRVTDFCEEDEKLRKRINELVSFYTPLTIGEIDEIKKQLKECIGHLIQFLYHEFEIKSIKDCIKEGRDLSVNKFIAAYCDEKNKNLGELVLQLESVLESYKPRMEIFDEYPELEDPFYEKCGPIIMDYEVLERLLTIDMIKGVVNGSIEVDLLIDMIANEQDK